MSDCDQTGGDQTAGMTNESLDVIYMYLHVSGLREREREIAYMEREIAMKTMNVTFSVYIQRRDDRT